MSVQDHGAFREFAVDCLNSWAVTQLQRVSSLTWDCWITHDFSAHIAPLQALCDLWCTSGKASLFLPPFLSFGRCKISTRGTIEMFKQALNSTGHFWSDAHLVYMTRSHCQVGRLYVCLPTRLRWVAPSTTQGCDESYSRVVVCVLKLQPCSSCTKTESWNRGHAAIFQGQRRGCLTSTSGGCHKSVKLCAYTWGSKPERCPHMRLVITVQMDLITLTKKKTFWILTGNNGVITVFLSRFDVFPRRKLKF